jgi:DDE superfamily endonuclease
MLSPSFLTPYCGTRYHLKEYSNHPPENAHELFNLRHSSFRNSVERAIGVLKKCFPIIASCTEAHYDVDIVSNMFITCCILHNFLMGVDPDEALIAKVDNELMHSEIESKSVQFSSRNEECRCGERMRDIIAHRMWHDYV